MIKIQKYGVVFGVLVSLCLLSSQVVGAETANDENSLENRLKAFNAPEPASKQTVSKKRKFKKTANKKKVSSKKRAKVRVAKKRRVKRACYQSSTSTLRNRADAFQPYIRRASHRYEVSEALIISVITAESCFYQHARSPKNARGLMQLIPATAKRFGVKNAYVASENIRGGTRYLKFLLERFSGNLHLVIAAYNAGEGAVDRYGGIPPYRETKEYVRRVMSVYRRLQDADKATIVAKHSREKAGFIKASSRQRPTVRYAGINRNQKRSRGYFIKPDYKWTRKSGRQRVSRVYQTLDKRRPRACRDVSSKKLRRHSRLVQRGKSMKRYYVATQPKSLSAISKITGVSLKLLLRMNRNASKYMVRQGTKVLVWQCAGK